MKRPSMPFTVSEAEAARFHAKVHRRGPTECWPFTAAQRQGYGAFYAQGKVRIASRVAWTLEHGAAPDGLVCHTCDNPLCCNPAHLWVGSNADNQVDAAKKGRHRGQSASHCKNGHEYTPENTYIRPGTVLGRNCRACNTATKRRGKAA